MLLQAATEEDLHIAHSGGFEDYAASYMRSSQPILGCQNRKDIFGTSQVITSEDGCSAHGQASW